MSNISLFRAVLLHAAILLFLLYPSATKAQGNYGTYRLMHTDGRYLQRLTDGTVVNTSLTGTFFGLRAIAPNTATKSVRFTTADGAVSTESVAPYAIRGDSGGERPSYSAWAPGSGEETLTVEYFSGFRATGTLLATDVLGLTFAALPPAEGNYGHYALIDTDGGDILRELSGGETIDLDGLAGHMSVLAVPPTGTPTRVSFLTENGSLRSELAAPHSIRGDTYTAPVDYLPWYPGVGATTVAVGFMDTSGAQLGSDALRLNFVDSGDAGTPCNGGTDAFPLTEGFEGGGTGAWAQAGGDDAQWAVRSGPTATPDFGPDSALEGGNYLNLGDADPANFPYKRAWLDSPCLDLSAAAGASLTFSYFMEGDPVGTLSLLASTDGGAHWREEWYLGGPPATGWNQVSADLSRYVGGSLQLRISAQTDGYPRGDIAIDALRFETATEMAYVAPVPSTDRNYVLTRTYQDGEAAATGEITAAPDVIEGVTYFDGLGRPEQRVAIHAAPGYGDLVTPITYDGLGRRDREWLPYPAAGAAGSYRSGDVEGADNAFYANMFPGDMGPDPNLWNAYSRKGFEASPLNRVLGQAGPGRDWALGSGHEVRMDYGTNIENEARLFGVSLGAKYTPALTGGNTFYGPGELYKNITRDENWTSGSDHTAEEFTDKQGRTVLRRTYDGGEPHDTHYVYDGYGNLSYVLPPKVDTSDGVSALELEDLCYQYRYDRRDRMIEKKIPGKGNQGTWDQTVYNRLDRPVMTQDANLREQGKWTFTKYDAHGRVAYTGFHDSSSSGEYLRGRADDTSSYGQFEARDNVQTYKGAQVYYTNATIPKGFSQVNTASYYDTYLPTQGQAGITVPIITVYGDTITDRAQGLPTVTRTRVLGTDQWMTTVMGYDTKGRAIWTRGINTYLGTDDITQSQLDFAGRVLEVTATHAKEGQPAITTVDTYTYDHMGRASRHTQRINGQAAELITANAYDAIGQVKQKKVGGAASGNGLQGVDYDYNIRGWLKGVNDPGDLGGDLFALGINYNDREMGAANDPLFNGNISETLWKTVNDAPDGKTRGYAYAYDALNRIKSADYGVRTTGAFDLSTGYDMGVGGYDRNGNIKSLTRQGAGGTIIDDLTYTYWDGGVANRLRSVGDAASSEGFQDGYTGQDDYYNDPNGNMKWDANKGMTKITYNHLNLPTDVKITSDKGAGTGTISYIYGADGTKLEKKVSKANGTEVTQYAGGHVYKTAAGATALEFFGQPEGYVERAGTGYRYVYQYTDHLGNIRLSYTGRPGQLFSSDFQGGMEGWGDKGQGVDRELTGGRMRVSVAEAYSGTAYPLDQSTASPGEGYTVDLTLDKATTGSALRLYIEERDADNAHLSYNMLSTDLPSGRHHFDYTVREGSLLILRIDKDNTDTDQGTEFFLDDVAMGKNRLTVVQEKNYYPFGLEHKGYNNVVNGTENNYMTYQGKELQKELDLNWHDFGARQYDPAIGRWISPDPLSEEFSSWSPYNAMNDNPINFVDPTGMAAEWIPKINEDGSASYIAEDGDSAATLSSQYGISQDDAEAITGTTGDTEIAKGTEISGATVNNVTGSEVLKLDLNSKEGKTSQRRFDQFLFGRDHSSSTGAFAFLSTDYYSNTRYKSEISGKATMDINGESANVLYKIPLYRPSTLDGSSTATALSNEPLRAKPTSGMSFPNNQANVELPFYHPNTGGQMGSYRIFINRNNSRGVMTRLRKEFPAYNYIRIPRNKD